jgi:plasmid rolling circle replication initiator protein Rep
VVSRKLELSDAGDQHLFDRCDVSILRHVSTNQKPLDGEFLSSFSAKDAKWDKHRSNTLEIGRIYDANEQFTRLGDRMHGCSNTLTFRRAHDADTGEIKIKLINAMFCCVRHCPVCQWRRSMRNTARFFAKLPDLREQFPKHRWLFLTLTVKNCDPTDLRATIKTMNSAWKRLIERKDWPGDGWARSVEVTRNESDGTAHPHFHALLMVKPSYFSQNYIAQAEWADRWQSALRVDYTPVVDVRAVKAKREGETIEAAIVETLKYSTKVEDAFRDPEWLYTITEQLHKMRFIATGGALKDILKDEISQEEMIVGDETAPDEDVPDSQKMLFGFDSAARKYRRKTQQTRQ